MNYLGLSIVTVFFSGVISFFFGSKKTWAGTVALLGIIGGMVLIVPTTLSIFSGQGTPREAYLGFEWGYSFSFFSRCMIEIDALTAFFLMVLLMISVLSALYGIKYVNYHRAEKHGRSSWFWFNTLVASMMGVFLARNAVFFLLAWEMMTVSSFFLVVEHNSEKKICEAGWIYLIASHFGTAFIIVFFLLLGKNSGSLNFSDFSLPADVSRDLLFILALAGFGIKAGIIPFHVWLPEAHPAAPSHVSAFMSGVMIKSGIYGLLRAMFFLGRPDVSWGWGLLILGALSGVMGVLYAMVQHDLKRLLAYHSVENIGIIIMGMGIGVLGLARSSPLLAVLGFFGCLFHVFNHAIFKCLLFLSGGAVALVTGTREIDKLGGVAKKMPFTSLSFLIGAMAISGLPPLNGFISEFVIYWGSFAGLAANLGIDSLAMILVITALAAIGGLALACFTKVFGIVFLGEARHLKEDETKEVGFSMLVPMITLALICVLVSLACPLAFDYSQTLLVSILNSLNPGTSVDFSVVMKNVQDVLWVIARIFLMFEILVLIFWGVRFALYRGKKIESSVTWDCGYAMPTARMQYTASSFVEPFVSLFRAFFQPREGPVKIHGYFPQKSSFSSEARDLFTLKIYSPFFHLVKIGFSRLLLIQGGKVNIYLMYILATIIALLIWKLI